MAETGKSRGWLQISAVLRPEQLAPVEERLLAAGALAVTLQDAADAPVLEPAPGEMPLWPQLSVTGLFAADRDPLALLAELHAAAPGVEWHSAALADRAWAREWLRDFKPLRFGERLAVVPHGQEAPANAVVVRLDPGLAFGTGTHPTTALCLQWLDGLARPAPQGAVNAPLEGACVLDYGCGSGILAIAALRLGASTAVAVDLDPQALLATRDNAAANGVGDRLTTCPPAELAAVLGEQKADILVANILAGPLQALMPEFADRLAAGGAIALSGILEDQAAALAAAAEPWFRLEAPVSSNGWTRLAGHRKNAR